MSGWIDGHGGAGEGRHQPRLVIPAKAGAGMTRRSGSLTLMESGTWMGIVTSARGQQETLWINVILGVLLASEAVFQPAKERYCVSQ